MVLTATQKLGTKMRKTSENFHLKNFIHIGLKEFLILYRRVIFKKLGDVCLYFVMDLYVESNIQNCSNMVLYSRRYRLLLVSKDVSNQ